MKDLIIDANFPRTQDGRVYHLGIKAGEVANRIVTVGAPSRAQKIATLLDPKPKPFALSTERGFLTITGRYKSVPVSIVSIGMGNPNVDFFIREVRECLSGDLVVVRLGSCGALVDVKVGTIVIPSGSIAVNRNYDYDFLNGGAAGEEPYRFSKRVNVDQELQSKIVSALEQTRPPSLHSAIVTNTLNASTDSFYSSQGRITSFPDHNAGLIDHLKSLYPDLATFEMETYHLLHLAASWPARSRPTSSATPPLSSFPARLEISDPDTPSHQAHQAPPNTVEVTAGTDGHDLVPRPAIRAAAAQMVFAARGSRDFITPGQVEAIEAWCSKGTLEALISFPLASERMHPESGSVWEVLNV
ncbi:purine and uridine phosphorylase [Panus rudis PR-1116 ss-1]|nr:purine and uridine phosphorylase [Panus rudis PR-1116 ss-1]